jgi:hypothetical protein
VEGSLTTEVTDSGDGDVRAIPELGGRTRAVPGGHAGHELGLLLHPGEPPGKVAWCELEAGLPGAPGGAGPAPPALQPLWVQREHDKRSVEAMRHPEILRRVRDSLRDLSTAEPRQLS